jgi:hypothetical protein
MKDTMHAVDEELLTNPPNSMEEGSSVGIYRTTTSMAPGHRLTKLLLFKLTNKLYELVVLYNIYFSIALDVAMSTPLS